MTAKKIIVFGATGTIGRAVVVALSAKYEVVQVRNCQGEYKADLADAGSVENVLRAIGNVDAIINAAGAANGSRG